MSLDADPTDLHQVAQIDAEKQRSAKFLAEREKDDATRVMGTASGRRFVWDNFLVQVYEQTFSTNAMMMSFAEGDRRPGISLRHKLLNWCPDLYQLMERENVGRDARAHNSK